MPLNDDAPLVPGSGLIFLGDPDTAKPVTITDPLIPGAGWTNIGHVSRNDLPEFTRDGDDPETIGSWFNPKLRQTSPDVTYGISFQSIQADADTFKLYFGAGDEAVQADGTFRIPARPEPQIHALLLILIDGQNFVSLWHPRVSLIGSDAVSVDTEYFMTFPIKGTFLGSSTINGAIGEWAMMLPPSTSAGALS